MESNIGMKKLYIIRHAKSSWKDLAADDFDRPLNKRGEKDAPFMGKILKKKGVKPDIIISSPALRAKTTAEVIAQEIGFKKPILYIEKIYEAEVEDLYDVVRDIDEKYKTVFIIGHNPGLNMFVESLVGFHENIPTCGIIELEIDCKNNKDISALCSKYISFDYPKRYK